MNNMGGTLDAEISEGGQSGSKLLARSSLLINCP